MSSPTPPGQPPQYPQQPQQPQHQQPPYPQQYGQQQYAPQPQGPKKTPVWVWLLVAFGVICILGIAAISIGSYFVIKTVAKNAGFDATLMKDNPGLAMAKMAAAMNPDLETVSSNDRSGTITMREKSTGKIVTMRFDTEKKTMVIVGDDGKEVKISANGDEKSGAVTVQTPDGTMKFGAAAGNSTPAWVPVYPGSSPQGTLSTQTNDGNQNTFTFKTNDAAGKVLTYYQDQLKSADFNIALMSSTDQGGMVQAEDKDKRRTIVITAGSSNGMTEGSITTVEKK